MADILFVTWDGGGNVPPAVAMARELSDRGHRVRFLGHRRQRPALESTGLDVATSRHGRDFSSLEVHSPLAMIGTFVDRGMGLDLLEAVRQRPADLVVIDCLMFGALDAARRAGLRYVVLEHFYDDYYERGCLRGPLGASLRLRRLAPRRALRAAAARLVATHPELDPGRGAGVVHVGPVVPLPRPPSTPGSPISASARSTVVVSLSTFAFADMVGPLQRVLDACAELGVHTVATTGPAIDPREVTATANVEVHRYVPHDELLPDARLLIGHGGHGSTMQALAHDVPVLVIPMDRATDQPSVGASLVKAGAGLMLAKRSSSTQIATSAAELMEDGEHRVATARLGRLLRELPGAARGADLIERLLCPDLLSEEDTTTPT